MKLKPSEKRLLIFLGIAFFLVGNFFLWSLLNEENQKVGLAKAKLEKEFSRLNALKSQIPAARERQEALAKYLKRYDSNDTRDTYLVTFVQNGVDQFGLKLAKNNPLPGEADENFIKSGYHAEVTGDYKRVFEFIHTLQAPTEFRFVKNLTLSSRKSDAGDGASDVVCDFVIQKWWHPDSDALLAEEPSASAAPAPAVSTANETSASPAVASTPGEQKPAAAVETKTP